MSGWAAQHGGRQGMVGGVERAEAGIEKPHKFTR
jgi:hypothetical protein